MSSETCPMYRTTDVAPDCSPPPSQVVVGELLPYIKPANVKVSDRGSTGGGGRGGGGGGGECQTSYGECSGKACMNLRFPRWNESVNIIIIIIIIIIGPCCRCIPPCSPGRSPGSCYDLSPQSQRSKVISQVAKKQRSSTEGEGGAFMILSLN